MKGRKIITLCFIIIEEQILTKLYLKKPVNNFEIGYIQGLEMEVESFEKKFKNHDLKSSNSLILKNIFGREFTISYKTVASISFEYNSAMIQVKSETSFTSRLGYKILKKFKPERIIIT